MSIFLNKNKEIMNQYRLHKFDTGSAYVQVVILTERIENITNHLKIFKKDLHCRYGLLRLVSRRKKLLRYIKDNNEQKYSSLIQKLGVRK